jgi:regulator of RNase E activity RraA
MHFSLGIEQQWLGPEITPLVPEMRAAGPAFTIRWIDDPDVNASTDTTLLGNMIDSLQPLSVPILATSKNRKVGYWGEMMCTVCLSHGVNSTVIEGGVRDPYFIWKLGFNMFAGFACPNDADQGSRLESFQEPISINNVAIRPGDFVVAEFGGVVIIPKGVILDVYHKIQDVLAKESELRRMIMEGATTEELLKDGAI